MDYSTVQATTFNKTVNFPRPQMKIADDAASVADCILQKIWLLIDVTIMLWIYCYVYTASKLQVLLHIAEALLDFCAWLCLKKTLLKSFFISTLLMISVHLL